MTAGVTATIAASIIGAVTKANDIAGVRADLAEKFSMNIQPGTGVGKADGVFSDTRTIAASGTDSLDLAGVLTDVFGSTIAGGKVKAIMIKASAANTNNVLVGGAGSATFIGPFADATDILALAPGAWMVLVHPGAGWAITATTADKFLIANSGGTTGVDYDIILILASA